jgi:hypothetical protein
VKQFLMAFVAVRLGFSLISPRARSKYAFSLGSPPILGASEEPLRNINDAPSRVIAQLQLVLRTRRSDEVGQPQIAHLSPVFMLKLYLAQDIVHFQLQSNL